MIQKVSTGLHVSCQSEDVRQQSGGVGVAEVTDGLPEARQALIHCWILEQIKVTHYNNINIISTDFIDLNTAGFFSCMIILSLNALI